MIKEYEEIKVGNLNIIKVDNDYVESKVLFITEDDEPSHSVMILHKVYNRKENKKYTEWTSYNNYHIEAEINQDDFQILFREEKLEKILQDGIN